MPPAPRFFRILLLPILIVACLLMTSGDRGVSLVTSCTKEILQFIHPGSKHLEYYMYFLKIYPVVLLSKNPTELIKTPLALCIPFY